jgi:hypothetical protein
MAHQILLFGKCAFEHHCCASCCARGIDCNFVVVVCCGSLCRYRFFGRFLADSKAKSQTTVKQKTRYPVWEDSEVPELHTLKDDVRELHGHALLLVVEDKREDKKDERIAQARIPLTQAALETPEGAPFSVTLSSYAWSMCGVVHGMLHLDEAQL